MDERPLGRGVLIALRNAAVVATLSCAGAPSSTSTEIPDTPAGRAFRAWLEAYNGADSSRLDAYVRRYEPAMSVHTQLVSREQTGPWKLTSIARSEPRHLEIILESNPDSTVGLTAITMYGVVDAIEGALPRSTTTFAFVGKGPRSSLRPISGRQRALAIDSVIAKVVRNYVFLDVANEVADSLRARRSRGAYDDYGTEISFAQRLNHDLTELGRDRQLGVEYAWRLPLPPPSPSPPAMMHCALEPARMLEDDVGYVKLYGFGAADFTCGHEISKSMQMVASSRALVIDLREAADAFSSRARMAYVATYLVARCTALGEAWDRSTGLTGTLWTLDGLAGPMFGGEKPLYILTSSRTFAAAEELAYDLQSLGRATIVGERTGGGAHVAAVGPVGDHLLLNVPIARVINPITKTNWQRVGVEPDVRVPASDALATAQRLIRERRAGRAPRAMLASSHRLGVDAALEAPNANASPPPSAASAAGSRRGIRFSVDTLVPYAELRVLLSRVAGEVEFADGRGRFDVTAISHAPAVSVKGIVIAEPLARAGDYYLFDNTGFILVRPSTRTFSRFAFTRADFNHTGALLPGAFFFPRSSLAPVDTLSAADVAARRQHAPVGVQWHAQPRGGPPPSGGVWNMYGRGWLDIEDAPAVEAGVARWFEVAASLGTRPDGESALPPENVEVTSVAFLYQPGARTYSASYSELLNPRDVREAEVDATRLVLPAGYSETRWPGFEGGSATRSASTTPSVRWRTLEDTSSQRGRGVCRAAWLRDGADGRSADAALTARSLRP